MPTEKYWVYILHCENDTYYTGYTSDLVRRYREHLEGSGKCKYTRSFKPVKIARCWWVEGDKGLAMRVESYIKKLSRVEKEKLIVRPGKLGRVYAGLVNGSRTLNAAKCAKKRALSSIKFRDDT